MSQAANRLPTEQAALAALAADACDEAGDVLDGARDLLDDTGDLLRRLP